MGTFIQEALSANYLPRYPLEGPWPYGRTFPKHVFLGCKSAQWPFTQARWKQSYSGVVAQYREDCTHNSMHCKVVKAGNGYWWVVDHDDKFNPDRGRPIAHFFEDYEPGMILKPAAYALSGLLMTRALVPLFPGI